MSDREDQVLREVVEKRLRFKGHWGTDEWRSAAEQLLAQIEHATSEREELTWLRERKVVFNKRLAELRDIQAQLAAAQEREERLRELLSELFDYVGEIESRYGAQVAVRSYLSFPQGAEALGDRVRAALAATPTDAAAEQPP